MNTSREFVEIQRQKRNTRHSAQVSYMTENSASTTLASALESRILKPSALKMFFAATVGYSLYYVCRLTLSVIKSPLIGEGVVSELQVGIIGSALFYAYAVGKLFNGFLADRVNIRKFATIGLLVSAVVNLLLGFEVGFYLFVVLWLVNGWAQSMGAASFIIGLTRWFDKRRRGTFYGFWSSSHNIGEGLTFVATALIVGSQGWRAGCYLAAGLGLFGGVIIWLFFRDNPDYERPASTRKPLEGSSVAWSDQRKLLKNPLLWLISLASMFMYVSRYSVNSWGVFFLERSKGYDIQHASMIISVGAIFGVVGTVFSGWLSDRFFEGDRAIPTVLAGLLNVFSILLFLVWPQSLLIDILSMACFGVAIGSLICFLGGLMAVDIAGKHATGAALGVVGMASYAGAGTQDIISGYLIGANKTVLEGATTYNFVPMGVFWVLCASLSLFFSICAWLLTRQRQRSRIENDSEMARLAAER